MIDLYAHHFFENPKLSEEYEDDDFDLDAVLAQIEAESKQPPGADDDSDWEDL